MGWGDVASKAFLNNIATHEIEIGSATPLFELTPWTYAYGEINLTVYYLLKMTTLWVIDFQFYYEPTIKQQCEIEKKSIMDDAISDAEI